MDNGSREKTKFRNGKNRTKSSWKKKMERRRKIGSNSKPYGRRSRKNPKKRNERKWNLGRNLERKKKTGSI
jgi:hypothetical protein